jgi:hypothetical protein
MKKAFLICVIVLLTLPGICLAGLANRDCYVEGPPQWKGAGCHRTGAFGYSIICCAPGYQVVDHGTMQNQSYSAGFEDDYRDLRCGYTPYPWPNYATAPGKQGRGPGGCYLSRGHFPNARLLCCK